MLIDPEIKDFFDRNEWDVSFAMHRAEILKKQQGDQFGKRFEMGTILTVLLGEEVALDERVDEHVADGHADVLDPPVVLVVDGDRLVG